MLGGLLLLACTGCDRTVYVTKQMTWECAPEEYKPGLYAKPDEYIRLRYVENPRCFEVESARNLCAQVRNTGKQVVNVGFEVWGRFGKVHGYRVTNIEGQPLQYIGGWGGSGANDYQGPSPISSALK